MSGTGGMKKAEGQFDGEPFFCCFRSSAFTRKFKVNHICLLSPEFRGVGRKVFYAFILCLQVSSVLAVYLFFISYFDFFQPITSTKQPLS